MDPFFFGAVENLEQTLRRLTLNRGFDHSPPPSSFMEHHGFECPEEVAREF